MKKIVLTGGGTAGHVTPNIALLPALQAAGYEIAYVGSYEGIEKKLIADFNIPYTGISTGKFRRYLDPKNFSDPFRVMKVLRKSSSRTLTFRIPESLPENSADIWIPRTSRILSVS